MSFISHSVSFSPFSVVCSRYDMLRFAEKCNFTIVILSIWQYVLCLQLYVRNFCRGEHSQTAFLFFFSFHTFRELHNLGLLPSMIFCKKCFYTVDLYDYVRNSYGGCENNDFVKDFGLMISYRRVG